VKTYRQLFWIIFIAGIIFRIIYILSGYIDLAADESYYWQWSRNLDWCYYSKGPLIAYLIRFGTSIFGYTELGVRFATILLSIITLFVSLKFYDRLFPNDDLGVLLMAVLYSTIPILLVGSVLMTIDPPLCASWISGTYFLYLAVNDRKRWAWIALGLVFGIGILAKYTMLLFIFVILFYLLLSKQNRRWFKHFEPYLAIFIGLCFLIPPMIWNANHHWVTFHHTASLGNIGVKTDWIKNLVNLPMMIIVQALIISPILFICLIIGIISHCRSAFGEKKSQESLILVSSFAPVLLFYMLVSFKRSINPNWIIVIYPAAILATAHTFSHFIQQKKLRILFSSGIGLGFLLCLVLLFSNVIHYTGLPNSARLDPAARLKGWQQLAELVDQSRSNMPQDKPYFIFGQRYQTASETAFYLPDHPRTYCASSFPLQNQYDMWGGSKELIGQNALLVIRVKYENHLVVPDHIRKSFREIQPGEIQHFTINNSIIRYYQVWYCYDFQGWSMKTEFESIFPQKS
jgi:4-amino-4-deoxy-L-arabinose transferase-like glycosyltransferase